MLQQAIDFRDESDALYRLLAPLADADLDKKTLFKDWTINHVLGHLHLWNWAADTTLRDDAAFSQFFDTFQREVVRVGFRGFEDQWLAGRSGHALLEEWREFYRDVLIEPSG